MVREPDGKGGQAKPFRICCPLPQGKAHQLPPWPAWALSTWHTPTHSHQPCAGDWARDGGLRSCLGWTFAGRGPHEQGTTTPCAADGPILGFLGSQQNRPECPSAPSAPSQQHLQTGVPLSNCPAAGGCAKGGPVRLRDSPGVGTASSASHSSRDTSGGLGLHAAGGAWGVLAGPLLCTRIASIGDVDHRASPDLPGPETWPGQEKPNAGQLCARNLSRKKTGPSAESQAFPGTNPVIVGSLAPTIVAQNGCPNTQHAAKLFGTGGLASYHFSRWPRDGPRSRSNAGSMISCPPSLASHHTISCGP